MTCGDWTSHEPVAELDQPCARRRSLGGATHPPCSTAADARATLCSPRPTAYETGGRHYEEWSKCRCHGDARWRNGSPRDAVDLVSRRPPTLYTVRYKLFVLNSAIYKSCLSVKSWFKHGWHAPMMKSFDLCGKSCNSGLTQASCPRQHELIHIISECPFKQKICTTEYPRYNFNYTIAWN